MTMEIAAFLGTQAFGNFIMYHLCAASVARAFPGSRFTAVYRDDRPYKNLITLMNPYVARTLKVSENPAKVIPLDWFDGDSDEALDKPDIFLTPSMLDMARCPPPAPGLRMPPEMVEPLSRALEGRGVGRDRWFVCVHMREPNYRFRDGLDQERNVDPKSYVQMIENIVKKQGGQVVRLGDPSMTPLPEMDGLIDLSRDEGSFPEQAFAASRARYFIGSETGPTQLASALKTPTAVTNTCFKIGVWNDGDVVLVKKFVTPKGGAIPPAELLEMGALTMHTMHPAGLKLVDNTPEELIAVANHMYEMTLDCEGWREGPALGAQESSHGPPHGQSITLPLEWRHAHDIANLTLWE